MAVPLGAVLRRDRSGGFPAPVLKTMLDWLACRTNLKEPLLDFASLHPGEPDPGGCPLADATLRRGGKSADLWLR